MMTDEADLELSQVINDSLYIHVLHCFSRGSSGYRGGSASHFFFMTVFRT